MSVLARIRNSYHVREEAPPWSPLRELPAYVLTIEEARQLVEEARPLMPVNDLLGLGDDALRERINTGTWTCLGLSVRVDP